MARLKTAAQAVPQTLLDAEGLAAEIAEMMRSIEARENGLAGAITALKLAAKAETAPVMKSLKVKFDALTTFAQAHRDEILPQDRKSRQIAAGIIGWRLSNPAVEIDDSLEDAVIAFLRENAEHLLVETVTISKAGILADREFAKTIPHVQITQVEQFFFKPLEVDLEQSRNVGKAPAQAEAA